MHTILSPATSKALTASPFLYKELNLVVTVAYLSRGSSSSSSSSSPSSPPSDVDRFDPCLGSPFVAGFASDGSGSGSGEPSPSAIR